MAMMHENPRCDALRCSHGARVLSWLRFAVLATTLMFIVAEAGAVEYRFRSPEDASPMQLGPQVLSDDERAYLASLPEIRVAISLPTATPYETVSDSGEVGGIHSEILVYLARAFGLRVKPVVMPSWSASLDALRRHEADLIMTVGVTNERTQYLEFTLGVTPWPGALFARTAATPVPLNRATFAIEREYMALDYIRRQYPGAQVMTVDNTGDALRAVAEGRADYSWGPCSKPSTGGPAPVCRASRSGSS